MLTPLEIVTELPRRPRKPSRVPPAAAEEPMAPVPASETDLLMRRVGSVARLLRRYAADGQHVAVEAELRKIGALAAPVAVELSRLLTEAQSQALVQSMCTTMTTIQPPGRRALAVFDVLCRLYDSLRAKRAI